MGQYFGLRNLTRKQRISSYWKGDPPDLVELMTLAHQFGWSEGDEIATGSYCSYAIWSWSKMRWEDVSVDVDGIEGEDEAEADAETEDDAEAEAETDAKYAAPKSIWSLTEMSWVNDDNGEGVEDDPHAPEWMSTGECRHCHIKPLDAKTLVELEGKYDTVFNWN